VGDVISPIGMRPVCSSTPRKLPLRQATNSSPEEGEVRSPAKTEGFDALEASLKNSFQLSGMNRSSAASAAASEVIECLRETCQLTFNGLQRLFVRFTCENHGGVAGGHFNKELTLLFVEKNKVHFQHQHLTVGKIARAVSAFFEADPRTKLQAQKYKEAMRLFAAKMRGQQEQQSRQEQHERRSQGQQVKIQVKKKPSVINLE